MDPQEELGDVCPRCKRIYSFDIIENLVVCGCDYPSTEEAEARTLGEYRE